MFNLKEILDNIKQRSWEYDIESYKRMCKLEKYVSTSEVLGRVRSRKQQIRDNWPNYAKIFDAIDYEESAK